MHCVGGQLLARAINKIPTLKKAYNKELEVYDVLIMPTTPFVAPKLPAKDVNVSGKPVNLFKIKFLIFFC